MKHLGQTCRDGNTLLGPWDNPASRRTALDICARRFLAANEAIRAVAFGPAGLRWPASSAVEIAPAVCIGLIDILDPIYFAARSCRVPPERTTWFAVEAAAVDSFLISVASAVLAVANADLVFAVSEGTIATHSTLGAIWRTATGIARFARTPSLK